MYKSGKNFYKDVVEEFIFKDIESCIKAKANFIVALSLMSYTEYLGGLITGDIGLPKKSFLNFQAGLEIFEYCGDFLYYKDFEVCSESQGKFDIYTLFRCGLVHEYFPKGVGDILIHNNPNPSHYVLEDKGIGWIDHEGRRVVRFHNNAFYRDFRNAWGRYYKRLVVEEQQVLKANFEMAIKRINGYGITEVVI